MVMRLLGGDVDVGDDVPLQYVQGLFLLLSKEIFFVEHLIFIKSY
jgi:hypothetical protein